MQRNLDWDECYNVRDLGGLPAADGRETRWRSIVRSDHLGRLTAGGRRSLLDYGVRTIIDLRSPKEAEDRPYSLATASRPTPTCSNIPLNQRRPHVTALIKQAETRSEVYCIILDYNLEAVAEIMRAIAFAQPGGVVVHCHSGKDRTGTISALLLSLAGVPRPAIIADYAESQERLWPLYEERIAAAGGEENLPFWLRPTATADVMEEMLDHVDSQYGGVPEYLRAAGLSSRDLKFLKDRLD